MQPHNIPNALPAQEPQTRTCSKCGQTKPATTEYFHRAKGDSLRADCKVCNSARGRAWAKANRERQAETHRAWIAANREHAREYDRAYRAASKERKAENHRAWVERNKEKWTEYDRAWHAANREKMREYNRAYHAAHKGRINKQKQVYRAANPELIRAIKSRRRAREIGAEGQYTADDVKAQYKRQKGRCYWCKCKVGDNYHVDHVVPLSRGGSNNPENIVIACPGCNLSKNNKLPHEWPEGGRLL